MNLMHKFDQDDHMIEQIHEIRREQIQFNDTVSSVLISRNAAMSKHFQLQQKTGNLLTVLLSASIILNIIGLLMMIVILTR